jgi:hypothetical protein
MGAEMILTTLAASAVLALVDPDPLAPARTGQVQCSEPDVEQKTCESIGSYRFEPDGRIVSKGEIIVHDGARILIIAEDEVYVRDGAECSSDPLAPDQIRSIEIDGEALSGDGLNTLRQELVTALNEALGDGELCSTYHPKPDGSMVVLTTVAGQPRADLTSTVRWVRREDGWRLQP